MRPNTGVQCKATMHKHLSRLYDLSLALIPSDYDFFHTSFLFHRNKLVSIGVNNRNKTNPNNLKFKYVGRDGSSIGDCVGVHSELAVVLKMPYGTDFGKLKLVNLRIRKDGKLGMSKPCRGCSHMISQLGLKEVWFTNKSGKLEKWTKNKTGC